MERMKLTEHEMLCHPSIHCTGSVRGMIERGFWGKEDWFVQCGQYIYNMSIYLSPGRIL